MEWHGGQETNTGWRPAETLPAPALDLGPHSACPHWLRDLPFLSLFPALWGGADCTTQLVDGLRDWKL